MKIRRITANLPEALLQDAQKACGLGITETLTLALEGIVRRGALQKAQYLRGKVSLREDKGRAK
ncbi:MAG: hypothetical protein AB7K68_05605 [Bacteriovoracia bacterium]